MSALICLSLFLVLLSPPSQVLPGRTSLFLSIQVAFTPASITNFQHGGLQPLAAAGPRSAVGGSDFVFLFSPLRIATVPTDPGFMAQACGGDGKNPESQAADACPVDLGIC